MNLAVRFDEENMAAPASCMGTEHGCVMFDCLVHLWEWIDPPVTQTDYQMENKKIVTATQQPVTQQHLMAHHVHPEQIYSPQQTQLPTLVNNQSAQVQQNGVMHQLLQSQYHSNMNARSPLLENRHEMYGTGHNHDYVRHYGANDNYNYAQSPPRVERTEIHTDQNVNHELLQNMPKGYNAEVYQDYLKRNPPKDSNQIYQNHQPMYRPNMNQYGSKPYLPYSNRIGPQSNTELLRRQYNEIQQMKMQQQMHYQNQAQMHQQQKFAERQLLLQQIHGVQPPPNLQNSIYSDSSYRDLDRYSSKNDFKEYSSNDIQRDMERYTKSNDYNDVDVQNRQYQEAQWQTNQNEYKESDRQRYYQEHEKSKSQSPPSDYNNQRNNSDIVSPMKSSESSTPSISIKSPSSDSRRSSSGTQALRSPTAQRIPSAPVSMSGMLYKQGSDGLKVWRKRWFVLSEYCLFYYKSQDEEKLLGSVLLPSYKVSACSAEDKVMRKFAFKLEHANMRTYVLAALDQEAMLKWVKALTMAALMQNTNEQQKQNDRSAKTEEGNEEAGPTYANAPPKPRRSNDGYNSPSPDMYDPNYDLLRKPASHYSQSTSHNRYQDTNYTQQESYRSPQSPLQSPYQTKRSYDLQQLSLPLTNTTETLENQNSSLYKTNSQSPYDNRLRNQHPKEEEDKIESLYDKKPNYNPFLQDYGGQERKSQEADEVSRVTVDLNKASIYNDNYSDNRSTKSHDPNIYNREVYGDLNIKNNKPTNMNERIAERRTPETYGRPNTTAYNTEKIGDYEDIYGAYNNDNGKLYAKSPNPSQSRDTISLTSHKSPQDQNTNYVPEKTFSGPSVLRRKKMQASGIQPPMPRPHSADFLEYESKNEALNNSIPVRKTNDQVKQPQRPKSSLDINSYYDPSSDKYYSEESYAKKMRQSAQYLQQQGLGPKNIRIPLEKYASGLVEKQLHSPYNQANNNNYETEFNVNRVPKDNTSYTAKIPDHETINSNWTLKEKDLENQKEFLNRSGSVMSDGSNISAVLKDARFDPNTEGFMRSASARLPSEREGEKKVQQREESMKRLLEWKQRMLQSPLTRKSTPATISLARSLNQSRQSLRSDQYKSKSYKNASYNSYSSDDEEESPGTDLQNIGNMQAGRSDLINVTCPTLMQTSSPHAFSSITLNDDNEHTDLTDKNVIKDLENVYENILATTDITNERISDDVKQDDENTSMNTTDCNVSNSIDMDKDGYETHDSEAESETQLEYTDNDLDEVLLESENEVESSTQNLEAELNIDPKHSEKEDSCNDEIPETLFIRTLGEDHYLPMSPRKMSAIEPAHKTILDNLSDFDQSCPQTYEDNHYVEMNLGTDDDDSMQTYELVCVNNGRVEPVYMELNHVVPVKDKEEDTTKSQCLSDTTSNFADTKEQTLKRLSKGDKITRDKLDSSDAEEENSSKLSLDAPFCRFSISDTFRPASYYLSGSRTILDRQDSSDSDILPPTPIPNSSPAFDNLLDEELSRYILDKLDKSDISQDNSIIKMLTSENQKMNRAKRKTTSLMIYGSRTSIHDTLTRGEKVRNSRASLTNELNKTIGSSNSLLNNSNIEQHDASIIETDSLRSYNADKGSSRLSIESDVSSKFDMAPSNVSSEIQSLMDSDLMINFRNPYAFHNSEDIKRRPLSDDSLFELAETENCIASDVIPPVNLDTYLQSLQADTSDLSLNSDNTNRNNINNNNNNNANCLNENNLLLEHVHSTIQHTRSSSTPVSRVINNSDSDKKSLGARHKFSNTHGCDLADSQSSFSSTGIPKSPTSFYSKNCNESTLIRKNLNSDIMVDKIKEFNNDKLAHRSDNETASSSITTGFHSRDSSTEHSAPYYYSDLSSQEHINVLPTSLYLKNTNSHRKLNNERRRRPMLKNNEIIHIRNPIRNNHVSISNQPFDLVASAKSVSVEFLSVVEKNPDIDSKNIYVSTSSKASKIPESMTLMASLGCKKSLKKKNNDLDILADGNINNNSNMNSSIPVSSESMSSHCSGNSSNTVYYDAEAEANAYENVLYHGENHWDEDNIWRDNLRRVSHRHARSMDDLDTMPIDNLPNGSYVNTSVMNSIKRIKKCPDKIKSNADYVNCDIQSLVQRRNMEKNNCNSEYNDENDVYVSLVKDSELPIQPIEEGVYEQLAIDPKENVHVSSVKNRRQFEIDRENLRQWDFMSSGLMKGKIGRVRSTVASKGISDVIHNTNNEKESTSNEASMTMSGTNTETGLNNNNNTQTNQTTLSNKAFLGSNTSIGRTTRDGNIPVRAVSPRVRWVEDKHNEEYGSQQLTISQHNLNHLTSSEDTWTTVRSPSRAMQQPIRAVSPRVRRSTENDELRKDHSQELGEVPTAGELLGRSHEELVLLLIQLRRRHAATHRSIEQCCAQISSIEDCLSSLKAMEREESLQRLEHLKMQLMDLESQYEKSKPLVQLVDNMVKLGSLYNRPGSTIERLERNQRLRQKVLAEHALEQQRWLEHAAAGKSLETEAARVRVSELWALEQELADEAAILQGLKTDKDAIDSLLTGVRSKLSSASASQPGLEVELARVHAMLAHNSKKLEQTVADNARLERELHHLRRALRAQRANTHAHAHPTALLEDEVSRVQHLVSALQRQRQELSRAVRHLTQQSHALQTTHDSTGKRRPMSSWQETNLDTGHTIDHGYSDYDYEPSAPLHPPGHYGQSVETPLYVDTRGPGMDIASPINSEDMQHTAFGNLTNVEKQEIKTVRIVKRESERRQRDRERSLQPMSDWSTNNITANIDQFLEEELVQPINNYRASSLPRTEYNKYEEYYSKPQNLDPSPYIRINDKNMDQSPKYPSSPSLSNYDYSRDISSLSSSYHKSYDKSSYDRTNSLSTQYLNTPTDSARTLTNDPMSKTSSMASLTRSNMELSPIFKSEAAKQIITEMSGDVPKNGSLHRRQVPKEKRRHYTAPHHLSAKTLNEMPKDVYNQDALGRSLDDADMERALRTAAPDVVRSALPPARMTDSIDQLLAAPQKIVIPERYIPEKPPELSPEEQQKRQEKVESIKKMLTGSSADPSKSPDGEDKRQREHLLQMNQILAKQVTEMSKIIAVKALEELPVQNKSDDYEDRSPDVELPIFQQRYNFFT